MNVKRYELIVDIDNAYLSPETYGEWVSCDDYEDLLLKYNDLCSKIEDIYKDIP